MAKYVEIYQDLLSRIRHKVILPNSYLPSENELMEEYSASRDTIRKALNLLQEKGCIIKEKGKGSKVLDPDIVTFPLSGITSFKELKNASSANIETEVIECEEVLDSFGQKNLNLKPDQPVTRIKRVRSYDGERVILDTDYLNPDIIPGLTKEIAADSIFEYIENELKLPISFARKEITVEPASKEEKKLLDLEGYDHLVVIRSLTYLEDATLFGYTESRHRLDKFRFLDLARRSKL